MRRLAFALPLAVAFLSLAALSALFLGSSGEESPSPAAHAATTPEPAYEYVILSGVQNTPAADGSYGGDRAVLMTCGWHSDCVSRGFGHGLDFSAGAEQPVYMAIRAVSTHPRAKAYISKITNETTSAHVVPHKPK